MLFIFHLFLESVININASSSGRNSGVAIWCAKRAVHEGPSLWGQDEPCVGTDGGALLELLHMGLLQPCYATGQKEAKILYLGFNWLWISHGETPRGRKMH